MKPSKKSLMKWMLVLAVTFVGYIYGVVRFRSQFAPAPHVRTFTDLQRQGVPMTRAVRLPAVTGNVCVFGDVQPFWTLPSGPPAYHFDATRRLIDFTLDVGDSTKFQRDYDVYRGTDVALADLPHFFTGDTP